MSNHDISSVTLDIDHMSIDTLKDRIQLIRSETRLLQSEVNHIKNRMDVLNGKIAENEEKIKMGSQPPFLVGNMVELLDSDKYDKYDSNGNGDNNKNNTKHDSNKHDKNKYDDGGSVVCSTTRVTSYLPMTGLVKNEDLSPGDLVSMHKDTNVIFEKLPPDYDNRVKAMELDDRPAETYDDIGGLEKQIQELNEAIVLPFLHPERFTKLNIRPPKGVIMYGPPGTGKTLMARACASMTNATFLKLAGPQLVQMYIGDGARLVRDVFKLAKEKKPSIIFIDEIDAIGTKRSDSDRTGDREVQRTMLELLNQLDGFNQDKNEVKIIAATNRIDILDPALLRSGRIDRKIEFPLPNIEGRKRILQIHARKMNIKDIDFGELARSTEQFNGAQCRAVCVEAGMAALRNQRKEIIHNDFMEGIQEVLSRKKADVVYYS
ncbi:26S protease regulatory subunit 6a [Spraguea lophii 42_110]|uniref:26S proteasome regulatory subunit 6A n=1 Tax=Spraguea lophii (strain 42_110) TaxID=1358809 RepID=S7XJQ5_SPRLO|nr:26S protease regulatory subunit 6a [Spraguea lophii 42_110]